MRRSGTNTSRTRDRWLIQKNILVIKIIYWPLTFLEVRIPLIPLPLSPKPPIRRQLYPFWVLGMPQKSGQQVDIRQKVGQTMGVTTTGF